MYECWRCGRPFEFVGIIGRQDLCDGCSSPVHACRNCKDWDRTAHNQCREPQAEYVADRENANFCNFFALRPIKKGDEDASTAARRKLEEAFGSGGASSPKTADDARAKLEAAFGKGAAPGGAAAGDDARARLEALFKK